jgi:hypothetical protein
MRTSRARTRAGSPSPRTTTAGSISRTAACVARAQAAIDAAAFDLETVRRQVETMTFDDLITYALETLA